MKNENAVIWDGTYLVREANELVEASYKFDVWEDRIFLLILSQIKFNDADFKEYKIFVRDLSLKYDIKTHDIYTLVKNAVESLRKKKITIPYRFGKDLGTFSTGLLASYGEVGKEELSYILVELHPKLKPYLLQLKEQFTQYNITFLMKMQSSHSKRIYKLLKQFENLGQRTFLVGKLREILCIEENEYKQYYDFKKRFILKAQIDLEKYTDICFDFTEKKRGRKVVSINFIIKSNIPTEGEQDFSAQQETEVKNAVSTEPTLSETQSKLYRIVAAWGIGQRTFLQYWALRSEEHIQTCIGITQKSDNAKDKAAYFLSLLQKEEEEVKDGKKEAEKIKMQEKQLQKEQAALKKEYESMLAMLKSERYKKEQTIIQGLLFNKKIAAAAKEIAHTKRMNGFDANLSFEENYATNRPFKIAVDNAVMQIQVEVFEPIWADCEEQESALKLKYETQKRALNAK